MQTNCAPPGTTRLLGCSRRYVQADLPARLRHWHAPRANRWERMQVVAGAIDVQWLEPAGVANACLLTGQSRWIGPGTRWRIVGMTADAVFTLEIHADQTSDAAQPQRLRGDVLDAMPVVEIVSASQLDGVLQALVAGQSILFRAAFAAPNTLREAMRESNGRLFWHPLELGDEACVAVLGYAAEPVGLADYLGRDHALIEAALAGALSGQPERKLWLHNLLARHLRIEEDVLFPAYLRAGGREGWVRGLCNEHRMLQRCLPLLDEPSARRRFLLLLDGHDEKEEQIVYPDIIARLGVATADVARTVVQYPPGLPRTGEIDRR